MREDSLVIANADDSTDLDPPRFRLKSDSFQVTTFTSCKSQADGRGSAPPLDSVLTPASAAKLDPLARNYNAPAFNPLSLPVALPSFASSGVGRTLAPRSSQVGAGVATRRPLVTLRSVQVVVMLSISLLLIGLIFHALLSGAEDVAPPPLGLDVARPTPSPEVPPITLLPEGDVIPARPEPHRSAPAERDEASARPAEHDEASARPAEHDEASARPAAPARDEVEHPSIEKTSLNKPTRSKERIPWWE